MHPTAIVRFALQFRCRAARVVDDLLELGELAVVLRLIVALVRAPGVAKDLRPRPALTQRARPGQLSLRIRVLVRQPRPPRVVLPVRLRRVVEPLVREFEDGALPLRQLRVRDIICTCRPSSDCF